MVQQRPKRSCYTVVIGLVVALASTFMACEFDSPVSLDTPAGINAVLNAAPVRSLDQADRWTVYEVPGELSVQHGFGCLEQGFAATKEYVAFRIQDSAAVPGSLADAGTIAGTIILNGWDVEYTNGDHHVLGLGTVIFNVTEIKNADQFALHWEAGGVLSDENGDDSYEWCYRYTLVFWNRSVFDAAVPVQDDVATTFVGTTANNNYSMIDIHGYFPTPPYAGPHAVVPRGFGLSYGDADHEVLQVGFDLGPATPVSAGNEITWTSQTVLKDEDSDDGHYGWEFVTVLSGRDIALWQPPTVQHLIGKTWVEEPTELNLSPQGPSDFCGPAEEFLEHYKVEKVPFDYAIPVLTGWDLSYECSEHHVERIGVYIVEFDYDTTNQTLSYTVFSTLRDDSNNGHAARYKVSILGLNKQEKGSEN
jgi:hypothetical protein